MAQIHNFGLLQPAEIISSNPSELATFKSQQN